MKKTKPTRRSKKNKVSFGRKVISPRLFIFALLFAAIGAFLLIKSFAAAKVIFIYPHLVAANSVGATVVKDTSSTNKNNAQVVELVNPAAAATAKAVLTDTTTRLDTGEYRACLNMRSMSGTISVTLDITDGTGGLPGTVMGTASGTIPSSTAYAENICLNFTNTNPNILAAAVVHNKTAGGTMRIGNVNITKTKDITSIQPYGSTSGWRLGWQDEFNEPNIESNWNVYTSTLSYDQACYTKNQGTNGNLEVKSGQLIVRTKYAPGSCGGRNYTSGYLRTDAIPNSDPALNQEEEYTISPTSVASGIVRIEMRAQMPPTVKGIWPGLWSRNQFSGSTTTNPYGELDLIERWGDEPNNMTYQSTTYNTSGKHTGGDTGYITNRKCPIPTGDTTLKNNCADLTNSMHVYAVDIDQKAAEIRYYIDGRLTVRHTSASSPVFDPTAWINAIKGRWDLRIMTQVIAVNDQWHPEPDANFTQAELKVDYVRVFTKN